MSNEIGIDTENTQGRDGDKVVKDENKTDSEREQKETKQRSVSFNRDVHVKRFGRPRESRGSPSDHKPPVIRKEPFTHLSEQELLEEANKVRVQAGSVTCTTGNHPEKFYSLPHRKKLKEDRTSRRNSDDNTPEGKPKSLIGRSVSDVSNRRKKERTSLSTLFRRAQRHKSPDNVADVNTKPVVKVKRSKSDVSDLKSSNITVSNQPKPIRKRSGSESEEFLKSLRNKKTQLSPIIESSPREDYFRSTSPLGVYHKEKLSKSDTKEDINLPAKITINEENKVNPLEKPPRNITKTDKLKPPPRSKRDKSAEKEISPPKTLNDKKLIVDEIDTKTKDVTDVKGRIKESIRKIKENVYGSKDMIHSSQQPPDKPPLTRGHTVNPIVRILKDDSQSPPPKSHLIAPSNSTNVNQPFSYTKPSCSPDPNLFVRNTSPDRVPTPVNKMTDKGVVYAQVVRENRENGLNNIGKQTVHKTYSPPRENFSDEDEGLGYEDRYKYMKQHDYSYNETDPNAFKNYEYKITDSPIKPRFREYKLTNFEELEPTYANEYTANGTKLDFIDSYRGIADGMDSKKKTESETKFDFDFNELSHRRELLESKINARRIDREKLPVEPVSKYLTQTDPIYEANKRMKATEKYVNETAKYYTHTLGRNGFTESSITEEYDKYDSDNYRVKYDTNTKTFEKIPADELDRREFIDKLHLNPRYPDDRNIFPPEPEYEPPSLEFNAGKPVLTPDEYKEQKYRVKKLYMSSQDTLQSAQKYKPKDDWFGKRKGHYASNPEIAQEREDDYANIRAETKHTESYHNSLRRVKNKDKASREYTVRRHGSGDSSYYRDDKSPRRYDIDSRLVDSGIENDFRKDSSGEIHRSRFMSHESDDDARDTSLFLASERKHTEDNYPSEQIYANGEYLAKFQDFRDEYRKEYSSRERSIDGGSNVGSKLERYDRSPSRRDNKIVEKPPKTKKLSGLEKVKQLFSRDSSKKSKKEKEAVEQKSRTRVLKSPEHLARRDSEYRRYTDPEPSDIEVPKKAYDLGTGEDERHYRISRENVDRHRHSRENLDKQRNSVEELDRIQNSRESLDRAGSSRDGLDRKFRSIENLERRRSPREKVDKPRTSPKDSDVEKQRSSDERNYGDSDVDGRYERRVQEERRVHEERRAHDERRQRVFAEEPTVRRSARAPGLDSPALAQRYRERRRLATPSPSPSPGAPRRGTAAPTSAGNWFKSLDRLTRKKDKKDFKTESILTTEDESARKSYKSKPLNSPAKNLRFFGDTDHESDSKHSAVTKTRSQPHSKHSTLRKTTSNSSAGIDEVDNTLTSKSYSLSNLHRTEKSESPKNKQYYKRNLHNISEVNNSETESQNGRKLLLKPPMSPYERISRSQSSSKTLKGSKSDLRRSDARGSSSELRASRQELDRDAKGGNRAATSGDSSSDSAPPARGAVYLHATTVVEIPGASRLRRSRDDVSSLASSHAVARSTTKSFSLFAPWTPRLRDEPYDLYYEQTPRKTKDAAKKSTSNLHDDRRSTLQKNKSHSQTTLTRRPQNNRLTSSSTTLYRKPEKRREHTAATTRKSAGKDGKKYQSSEILSRETEREGVSRSLSMPKDRNKKAGWFNLSNKNKKQENNTRVR